MTSRRAWIKTTSQHGLGLLTCLLLALTGSSCKPGGPESAPPDKPTVTTIQRPQWPPVEQIELSALTPVESGPGIVVCEPFQKSGPKDLDTFGVSCGRWLHIAVAGHGELGKTPTLFSLSQINARLKKRPAADVTPNEAATIEAMTGVTHIATGEIEATPVGCKLTYRLWALPDRKEVGTPLEAAGTEEQVMAALPQIATQIAQRLGVSSPRVPSRVEETAEEMRFLGSLPWIPFFDEVGEKEMERVRTMQPRSPIATLITLRRGGLNPSNDIPSMTQAMMQRWGSHPLIGSEISFNFGGYVLKEKVRLLTEVDRFPNNYLLRFAIRNLCDPGEDCLDRARSDTYHLVRCAPRDPYAWQTLTLLFTDAAQRVRQSRFYSQLNSTEMSFVEAIYPKALECAQKSTELDPSGADYWRELAITATFAGDAKLADKALWKALSLEKDNPAIYGWGLQMYQPKWGGDPAKLKKVALLASQAKFRYGRAHEITGNNLSEAGFDKLGEDQLLKAIAMYRQEVVIHADDYARHLNYGKLLAKTKKTDEAIKEYQAAIRLNQKNKDAYLSLGELLTQRKRPQEAVVAFKEALRLEPKSGPVNRELCRAYIYSGDLKSALEVGKMADLVLGLDADTKKLLGYIYWKQNNLPASETILRRSLQLDSKDTQTYLYLGEVLMKQGKKDEARSIVQQGLMLGPPKIIADDMMKLLQKG